MAKTTLATNYKDDALNSAMGGKRQYTKTTNANGTISLTDASVYDTVGSNFGASVVNEMNRNINESFDAGKIISDMDTLSATTAAGYVPDALLLKEVNDNFKIKRLTPSEVQYAKNVDFTKSGKICILTISGLVAELPQDNYCVLCDFPEGCVPIYGILKIIIPFSGFTAYLYLNSNGVTIRPISGSIPSTASLYVSEAYITW